MGIARAEEREEERSAGVQGETMNERGRKLERDRTVVEKEKEGGVREMEERGIVQGSQKKQSCRFRILLRIAY